jgi:hypothetical protein
MARRVLAFHCHEKEEEEEKKKKKKKKKDAPSCNQIYALYLYFSSRRSFRMAARCLSSVVKRRAM